MTSAKKSRVRRTSGRHRKINRQPNARLQWLAAGAVAVGLGATMATGHGLAAAHPRPDYGLRPPGIVPLQRTDSDGDGLFDDDETGVYNTNPDTSDTDGDGSSDGEEVFYGTDPLILQPAQARPDSDGDGLFDQDETGVYNTNPDTSDTDGDSTGDGQEVAENTDPKSPPAPEPESASPPPPPAAGQDTVTACQTDRTGEKRCFEIPGPPPPPVASPGMVIACEIDRTGKKQCREIPSQ